MVSILSSKNCQSWHGWVCIQARVVLFQNRLLTGVLLLFEWGEVLFKSGVVFARIRYFKSYHKMSPIKVSILVCIKGEKYAFWVFLRHLEHEARQRRAMYIMLLCKGKPSYKY